MYGVIIAAAVAASILIIAQIHHVIKEVKKKRALVDEILEVAGFDAHRHHFSRPPKHLNSKHHFRIAYYTRDWPFVTVWIPDEYYDRLKYDADDIIYAIGARLVERLEDSQRININFYVMD